MIGNVEKDTEKVFDYIQEKLTSSSYTYGEKLTPELIIKDKLNVSRSVVREGMNTFSSLGILERIQGDGTYPTNKSSEEYINELLEIKEKFDLIMIDKGIEKNKEKLLSIMEKRLECIKKEKINHYKMISYYDKQISELSENNIMINFYGYIYKFVDKLLKKKIQKQSKEEIFQNYEKIYMEILER